MKKKSKTLSANHYIHRIIDQDDQDSTVYSTPDIYRVDFDERVEWFNVLSKSPLFTKESIRQDDLRYWFPEIASESALNAYQVIPKARIHESLECVIAELMEDL